VSRIVETAAGQGGVTRGGAGYVPCFPFASQDNSWEAGPQKIPSLLDLSFAFPVSNDLRLSHGGRRRRCVLCVPRGACADSRNSAAPSDQKVGRARSTLGGDVLSGAVRGGSRDAALIHHDQHMIEFTCLFQQT
jgi:hypothetical protein